VVLIVGVLDDLFDVSYITRSIVHLAVVIGIWLTDGLMVESIGAILGGTEVVAFSTGVGLAFTAVAVIGAINAVNMMDGVDGLLGSLLSISLFALLITNLTSSNALSESKVFEAGEIAILLGALAAFLLFNARVFKRSAAGVYMGDAGSTVLGFVLVYMLIDYSQGNDALFSPVVAGWILGLPLLDASAVIVKRVIERKSPFEAGRDHLHHLLMDRGLGVNKTVCIMLAGHSLMVAGALMIAMTGFVYLDLFLFWGFVGLLGARLAFTLPLKQGPVTVGQVPQLIIDRETGLTRPIARRRKNKASDDKAVA